MANNMIALQARAPQSSGLGGIIQQNAQLINMMTQQRAAEAERAQRQAKMEQDAAVAKQALEEGGYKTMSAQQKAVKDFMELSYEGIRQSRNPEDVMLIANALKQQFNNPVFHQMIDVTVGQLPKDPAQFSAWKDQSLFNTMSNAEQMGFKIAKPKSEVIYDAGGGAYEARIGGVPGSGQGAYALETYTLDNAPATPTRKGEVTLEPSVTVEGGEGGPYEPAPQAIAPGATPSDPVVDLRNALANVRNDAEYQQWLNAAGRIFPDFAAEARQYTPKFNPAVVQRMIAAADGYIKGQDPDQAAAAAPPATAAADFPMVAGPRGGPYVATGKQFVGRNPSMGQYPGSALVAPAVLGRQAAAEEAGKQGVRVSTEPLIAGGTAKATERAKSDTAFLDAYPGAKDSAQQMLSLIDQMIGDLSVKNGRMVKGKRPPHPGFEDVIGATWRPGARFFPATNAADFDALFEQVGGGAFMDAYKTLKGTGQITEKEGEKATAAITRMSRSQSEVGFVQAAREFANVIRTAVARADARAAKLQGKTPTSASQRGRILRYNPATGELE